MENLKYYHPKDLVTIFHSLGKARGDMEHLAYKINYFLKTDLKKNFNFRYNKLTINPHTTKTVRDMMAHRLEQLSFSKRILIRTYEGNIESPLIHGSSSGNVLETSITIHPIYGVPYLPSSSIKGIVRNYFLQTFFKGSEAKLSEDANRTEEEEQLYKLYTDIFGSQSQRGQINFLDVFVVSGMLRPDILAVHSHDYYKNSGKIPATDESPPFPISFYVLTSTEPVEFIYYLQKGGKRLSDFTDEALLKIAGKWLTSALTLTGIGSKTTRGYGRFSNFIDVTEERIRQLQERRRKIEKEQQEREQREKEALEKETLLSSMTEEEKLVYYIKQLKTDDQEDRQHSKGKLFNDVIEMNNKDAALALKDYWKQTKDWIVKDKPKKKQEKKVKQLIEMIGED